LRTANWPALIIAASENIVTHFTLDVLGTVPENILGCLIPIDDALVFIDDKGSIGCIRQYLQ
jgi:hypothetical protein